MFKKKIALFLIISVLLTLIIPTINVYASIQATYYVSPTGSDINPGTESQPFATIQKARDVIRTINSNMTGDIIVYLREGTYTLSETLAFNQSDSGTNGYNIIYENYSGEKPVISGGSQVTGWSIYDGTNGIYRATVPSGFDTRQLYVDGVRAIRARSSNSLSSWTPLYSHGYESTGYSSNTNNVYVTIDLGSSQTISVLELCPSTIYDDVNGGTPGFPVDFTIQVSTNGSDFTTVKTVTGQANPNDVPQTYSFTPISARYVKVNVTKLGAPASQESSVYRLQLAEIKVYASENLALNMTSTYSSSVESPPSFSIDNLTDGNKSTLYSSTGHNTDGATEFITVDLGSAKSVGMVKLYSKNSYSIDGETPQFPVDFIIQTSTDGTNFSTVKTITDQPNPYNIPQEYTFTSTNARYVKINVTKLGIPTFDEYGVYRFQLGEIEVYSSNNLALGKTATTSSSVESTEWGIDKIIDGNDISREIGYIISDSNMVNWKNKGNMELVLFQFGWQQHRCGVSTVTQEGSNTLMKMQFPCWSTQWGFGSVLLPQWIENAYELIDSEGEWYLDKTGSVDNSGIAKIYYKPRYGENMFASTIIAPNLETLIKGTGTLDTPIHNIQFQGITFQYSSWLEPNSNIGYTDTQAGLKVQGINVTAYNWTKIKQAVTFYAAKNINFTRNVFTHLGGSGMNFEYGSQDNSIIGNRFVDISGNGIYIGDVWDHHPSDTREIVKNNTVKNNYFTRTGAEYYDSVPIWIGFTDNTLVEHNEIYNAPYTGISVGWGWGKYDVGGSAGYTTPTCAQNNKIQYNLIQYVLKKRQDGGGIYTLSSQPNSTINNNYIHYVYDAMTSNIGGAIYPDEGSKNFNINNNVLRNSYEWLHIWTSSIQNITAQYNYSDTSNYRNDGTNITISNNTTVTDNNWPTTAQNIMNNAGIESSYQDIRVSDNENLALYQPAYAGSTQEAGGFSITTLTDGMRDGCYTSDGHTSAQNTEYVIVDLGASKTIGSVKLFPRGVNENGSSACFPVNFTIQTSTDGIDYSTVKTITGQSNPCGKPQEYAFTPISARYVKINATQLGDPDPTYYRLQLTQIEIYTKANLAWGKTITASSSQEATGWGAAKLVDGVKSYMNVNAGYTSDAYSSDANNVWLKADLGSTYSISSVKLYPRLDGAINANGGSPNFPVNFAIQVSTDGTNYNTVSTITNEADPNGTAKTYTFSTTNARYVKINVTKLGSPEVSEPNNHRLQLSELEIYP